MRTRSAIRLLLAALLLGAASGCFVGDEIDKASKLSNGGEYQNNKAPADAKPGAAGTKTAAAAKPGDGANANAAAKPAGATGKAWWQTAHSLTSEESAEGIARCELRGGIQFMEREDCLARGGQPK